MQADDWNDYQAFLAVAQTGQLVRAARLLKVDATTIGRRLRRLEARLNQTLFEQTREGQLITESGEKLLAEVEGMAAAAARISSGSDRHQSLSGSLRIGVPEGFGTIFLTRHLGQFAALHPHLTIDVVANSSYLSLSKREADVAVFLSRPRAGPLIAQRVTDYTLGLYASDSYLRAAGVPKSLDELAERHTLVGYIPDLLYAPELRYLEEIHSGLAAQIRSSSINAQYRLLAHGAGIGVLPCFMGDGGELVRVMKEQAIRRSFWLVAHRDTHHHRKVMTFVSWLRALVKRCQPELCPN